MSRSCLPTIFNAVLLSGALFGASSSWGGALAAPQHSEPNGGLSTATEIDASQGGVLKLTNARGDLIELEVPPGALAEFTKVTIVAPEVGPASPFARVAIPGIGILPNDLLLKEAARLRVTWARPVPFGTVLFRLRAPDLAVPMGDGSTHQVLEARKPASDVKPQTKALESDAARTTECEVFRGGTYLGGAPSDPEIKAQAGKLADAPPSNYADWQEVKEWIRGMLKYVEMIMLGGGDYEPYLDAISDAAGKVIKDFLSAPVPAIPCDEAYTKLLFELAELGMVGLVHNLPAVDEEFQKRIQSVVAWCLIRYELEVDYTVTIKTELCWWGSRVRGRVPLFVNTEDHFRVQGNGQLMVTARGGDCGRCQREGFSGSGRLAVTGQMHFNGGSNKIRPDLELHLTHDISEEEVWNCPGPGGSGRTTDSHKTFREADQVLHILPFNGSRVTWNQALPPGRPMLSHELIWILHHVHRGENTAAPTEVMPAENARRGGSAPKAPRPAPESRSSVDSGSDGQPLTPPSVPPRGRAQSDKASSAEETSAPDTPESDGSPEDSVRRGIDSIRRVLGM